jgi:hypothetical protein
MERQFTVALLFIVNTFLVNPLTLMELSLDMFSGVEAPEDFFQNLTRPLRGARVDLFRMAMGFQGGSSRCEKQCSGFEHPPNAKCLLLRASSDGTLLTGHCRGIKPAVSGLAL